MVSGALTAEDVYGDCTRIVGVIVLVEICDCDGLAMRKWRGSALHKRALATVL